MINLEFCLKFIAIDFIPTFFYAILLVCDLVVVEGWARGGGVVIDEQIFHFVMKLTLGALNA